MGHWLSFIGWHHVPTSIEERNNAGGQGPSARGMRGGGTMVTSASDRLGGGW